MFETLSTGIEELDLILGGGIRYPKDTAAFAFITGGPGTGKTILGLEIVTRAWLNRQEGGGVYLFYSVEQGPIDLQRKLEYDFGNYFGSTRKVRVITDGLIAKVQIEIDAPQGGTNRLVILQANPAALQIESTQTRPTMDIEWIRAEIQNLSRAENVVMVGLDNVGLLLSDMKYMQKRAALLQTRRDLMRNRIHGLFIQEEPGQNEMKLPSPEEFSTDLLLRLSFHSLQANFKARMIEVEKARHQYYYRGQHHFSIVGRDLRRDQFLGARSEKNPGVQIYPSIPCQLSLLRDLSCNRRPPRGPDNLVFGLPELDGAFKDQNKPLKRSSTVLLAEPGSRYSALIMHFLQQGLKVDKVSFMVSTKEDQDALLRVYKANPDLGQGIDGGGFPAGFKMQYLEPELIPPGKFTWDILALTGTSEPAPEIVPEHRRLVFDNIHNLEGRFPLIQDSSFLVLTLLDLLRHRGISPLFVDLLPPSENGKRGSDIDLRPYISRYDNVIHLYSLQEEGKHQVWCRIIKAIGCEFDRNPFALPSLS